MNPCGIVSPTVPDASLNTTLPFAASDGVRPVRCSGKTQVVGAEAECSVRVSFTPDAVVAYVASDCLAMPG